MNESATVRGYTAEGFEAVRAAFEQNLSARGELGAACSLVWRGQRVVDLWGGLRDAASGEPWQKDTLVLVYSVSKGVAAAALALLHERGQLDYESPVAYYWPEFAQNGAPPEIPHSR